MQKRKKQKKSFEMNIIYLLHSYLHARTSNIYLYKFNDVALLTAIALQMSLPSRKLRFFQLSPTKTASQHLNQMGPKTSVMAIQMMVMTTSLKRNSENERKKNKRTEWYAISMQNGVIICIPFPSMKGKTFTEDKQRF